MNLDGFERIRLMGDEDCGVSISCLDCPDGGRPLGYYEGIGGPYYDDPLVANVDNVPALLAVARAHLDEHHKAG